jgi:hypothetical protein
MPFKLTCTAVVLLLPSALCAQKRTDHCEVYVVDVKSAQLAWEESLSKPSNPTEVFSKLSRIIGTFNTEEIGEEVLTTRHFPFPNSELTITVSVFYTDESLSVRLPSDPTTYDESILLGLVVAKNKPADAIHAPDSAVAEVTYLAKGFGVRIKKLINVRGRDYLVGMECSCNGASTPDLDRQ